MKQLYSFLLILVFLNVFSQSKIDSLRYKRALKAPQTTDVKYLARFLKVGAKTDSEVVETFYYWIAQNIEYDVNLYKSDSITDEEVSVKNVLAKKKSICEGYANLMLELCNVAKIECEKIVGEAINNTDNKVSGHAWNAVKINDEWKLIDITWGTGAFLDQELKEYSKEIDLKYLFGNPDYFIIDHFPEEERWQLLAIPISKEKFLSSEWKEMRFEKFNSEKKTFEIKFTDE
jgi:transglutaminase/protease-like cytokinesis protein 3